VQQFDALAVMAARIAQECQPEDLRRPRPRAEDRGRTARPDTGASAPPVRTASAERAAGLLPPHAGSAPG
jgi:hypothetical protein